MSLFVNSSNLNTYQTHCAIDVGETIERDCLSVLHKLHDQVNGLQLVQVVVQPLARLFNPASLATLVSSTSQSNSRNNSSQANSNSDSATTYHASSSSTASNQTQYEQDGPLSGFNSSSPNIATSLHPQTPTFPSYIASQNIGNTNSGVGTGGPSTPNSVPLSSSNTYMMSPDTAQALIARLDTDRDVNWLMEIIGYGLSMPFSPTGEQDSVKDCCTIYCEWLAAALLPYNDQNEDTKYQQLSKLVPVPIREEPNRYARKMLSHLYNVFLPRQVVAFHNVNQSTKDQLDSAVSRQAVLCHRVLRTIESIAQNESNLMDNETWDHLLALLLTVNDKLLSGPTEPDDIGTKLHDRTLGVLFELILLASAKSIPTPELWKTFHERSLNWRHRPALVDHWRRITLLLTKRVVMMPKIKEPQSLVFMSHNDLEGFNMMNLGAIEAAIATMSYDNLSQTWYKFLNLIGNPVELSDPNVISLMHEFYHSACASDSVLDPRQHPCLYVLPQIFLNSISGLKDFIESFLGTYQSTNEEASSSQSQTQGRASHNQPKNNPINSYGTRAQSSSKIQSNTSSQQVSSNAMQPGSQPQALTPTQSRKTGIKSMIGGKVMPFNTSSSNSTVSNTLSPVQDNHIHSDHPKSGSVSGSNRHNIQHQFMQQRPSITSLTSRTVQGILSSSSNNQTQKSNFVLSPDRPKCNSILHIFGDWLFSAALIGSDLNQEVNDANDSSNRSIASVSSSSTATEVSGHRSYSPSISSRRSTQNRVDSSGSIKGSKNQDYSTSSTTASEKITLDPPLSVDSFESGQAEAMSTLCKIFSSKSSSEDISPAYLSRFYLCLQHCLSFGIGQDPKYPQSYSGPMKRQLLASVLMNSTSLLQKDLDGINLLIPSFIKAIEIVFECNERDEQIVPPPRQHNRTGSMRYSNAGNLANVTSYDLRRACILTLINLLAYPFHFQELVIRNCLNESSPTNTFGSLRPRLLKLLFVALQTETDPGNMQILFGGLSLAIHDLTSNSKTISASSRSNAQTRCKKDSTSSVSNPDSDTVGSSLDSIDIRQKSDETESQSSFVFNSNGGFLVKSLHVTCHLLINIWKHDTQVSLAAIELLTTIARVSTLTNLIEKDEPYQKSNSKTNNLYNNNNNRIEMRNEYKQATKWICDYICNQCSRPPPAHSRDMHSTIVAAYQCLSVWFHSHPYLFQDENCINTLMEVIELGVSGQKSKSTAVNTTTGAQTRITINKSEKMMKPSSMRVREAAESLMNVCMTRARALDTTATSFDTALDEQSLFEMAGSMQDKSRLRQIQDSDARSLEIYRCFKYFSDEDSVIIGLLEGSNHDPQNKDSLLCLLRTPFGKHCWKFKFNYFTEKSKDKIIANRTLGLIKRPFQQSTTPNSDTRMFPFSSAQNKIRYFNNSARFFPESLDDIPANELDNIVTSLDSYTNKSSSDKPKLRYDLDRIGKMFSHQSLAEQKVMSDPTIRLKRVDCEEPQPSSEIEANRMMVTQFGLKNCLSSLLNNDKVVQLFANDLKSLDHVPVRTCDLANIFYVRKNRTDPKEILGSVRERHNVSLSFFEWILELGQPTVVKTHSRWTGKISSSWQNHKTQSSEIQDDQDTWYRNQMLASDHGGCIFDGDRMTLYWSDMCQELAFLVPHKIERFVPQMGCDSSRLQAAHCGDYQAPDLTPTDASSPISATQSPGFEEINLKSTRNATQDSGISSNDRVTVNNECQNFDRQSLCSVTSDASSHSAKIASQHSSPRDPSSRDQRDNTSLSRHSIATSKRKSTYSSTIIGCDTNIIICWLECQDDLEAIPGDALLTIAANGFYLDQDKQSQTLDNLPSNRQRCKDFAKYFISPMKNGLYRVNLSTSFGRKWIALPLVDGMTVSKGILSSLIRESILNLCRRRRLDADSYQPPHVKRRFKIQEICNSYKISSRHDPTEFYSNLFK